MEGIDARYYGRAKSEMPTELTVAADVPTNITDPARTVDVGSIPAGEATAIGLAKQQSASMIAPTRWEAFTAGVAGMGFMDAYKWVTRPTFEQSEPNFKEVLRTLPFVLSESEYSTMQNAKSAGELNWLADNFKHAREIDSITAEYPMQNLAVQFGMDPTTYASGFAALKVSKLMQAKQAGTALAAARAVGPLSASAAAKVANTAEAAGMMSTRLAAGTVSAAVEGAVNLAANEVAPITPAEQAFQMLASFAGGAMIPRAGTFVPADPYFPSEALQASVSKPHMRLVSPAEYADEVVPTLYHRTTSSFDVSEGMSKQPNRLGVSFAGEAGFYFSHTADEPTSKIFGNRVLAAEAELTNPAIPSLVDQHTVRIPIDMTKAEVDALYSPKWHNGMPVSGGFVKRSDTEFTRWINPEVLSNNDVELLKSKGYDGIRWGGAKGITMPPQTVLFDAAQVKNLREVLGNETVTQRVKVKDAVFEEVPKPLRAGASATPDEVADAVEADVERHAKSWGRSFGETIMWNVNKTMRKLQKTDDGISDLLVDNNNRYGITSVESEKAAIRRDLGALQWSYEEKFREAMGERGHGTWKHLVANRETREASAALENEVSRELMRRETLERAGRVIEYDGVNARVKELADSVELIGKRSLDELKAAGVSGAESIQYRRGYFHRTYSARKVEGLLDEMVAGGFSEAKAQQALTNLMRGSLRRANGWDEELATDVAHAIVSRTLRKGRHEDAPMHALFGKATASEIRDMLKGSGISQSRQDKVIEALTGKADEAGKVGYLKHRVELDYGASMTVNGRNVSVADLIETNLNTILDRYIDSASSQAAFARKGLSKPSDIQALRSKYIRNATDRAQAEKLFDNVIKHLNGMPTGEDLPEFMRNASAFGRMITLGNSGIYQATEYVGMMVHYGALKTLKYTVAEMPLFKELMKTAAKDKVLSRDLKDILTNMAEQNVRMRPYLQKFEDNFEIPQNSRIGAMAQQGQQMIPYVNFMKYMHAHQARVHANLLLDVVRKAATGDTKAMQHLEKYGLKSQGMDKLREAFNAHGFSVDKWDDATWAAVRPTLTKMTDESVLHARMGDMPAFALMTQTGKFIFTYRSFVLTAHNKVLAGTSARDGLGAVALMAAYQFPLAILATQAKEVAAGKKPLEDKELITKSIGQMGALGLVGEFQSILFGDKTSIGNAGMIPFDRAARLGNSTAAAIGGGDAGQAVRDASAMIPLLSITAGFKPLVNYSTNKE